MLQSFTKINLIQLIYNETLKEYKSDIKSNTGQFHYNQYYNYFMGMRVTYNRAKQTSTSETKSGTTLTRQDNYNGDLLDSFTNVQTTDWGRNKTKYSKSGGFEGKGGYIIHFTNDMTIDEAVSLYSQLIEDGLMDKAFLSLAFELTFYNENYQTGVVLAYNFIQTNAGKVNKIKTKRSFFESRYQSNYHQISDISKIVLIILEVIYILGVVWLVYMNTIKIYSVITIYARTKTFTLDFYGIIDISVSVCKLVALGYRYYQVFNQSGITLKNERIQIDELSKYIDYADVTQSFTIVASLTTVLISVRFLRILMTQFPSFGALFETIAVAIRDIISFICSVFIIAIGFIMTACFLFGDEISDFSTFQNSLNKIFYYIFGIGTASEYSIYYQMLFQFFFITASMLFFFTLTKMLVSMVIIRYRYLRSLKQKRNEAMARIISNKSQKLKEKLLNLILFRRQDLSSNKDGEEVDERSIISRRWMIFKLNFNDLFKIGELKSLDEKEAEIKEIEQQIKQEKLTLNLNKLKKYSEENIEEHKRTLIQAIIYSIFLIIFVTIITSQINLELCYSQKLVGTNIKSVKFEIPNRYKIFDTSSSSATAAFTISFDEIMQISLIGDWFSNLYKLFQDNNFTYLKQNYFIGDPFCRILLRRLTNHTNTSSKTDEIFETYISNTDFGFKDNLGSEADTSKINIPGISNYMQYGNSSSPNRADGYLYYLGRNNTPSSIRIGLQNISVFSANTIHLVFQMVLLNKNNEFYSLHEIVFKKYASGQLNQIYNVYSMSNSYKNSSDFIRAIFEVIFIMMTSYYLYKDIKNLSFVYLELEKKYLESQSDDMKINSIPFRILGFNKILYANQLFLSTFVTFIFRLFITFIRSLYQLLISLYRHTTSSIFALLDIVSISLIIASITIWIKIVTTNDFIVNSNGQSQTAFDVIDLKTNYLIEYNTITSINTLLMFLNIMQYFSFSSKLSMFYEIMSNGLFDIVFFTLMQIIIMLGYSLMGYMLFGMTDENFSTIYNSCMTLFLMIIGNISIFDIVSTDYKILYLFGITFTLINVLLLNMLVAIYASHYFQFYSEQGDTKINALHLFLKILGGPKIDNETYNKYNIINKLIYKVRLIFSNYAESIGEKNSDSNENKCIVNYDYLFNNPDFYVCTSKQMKNFVYPNEENNVERKIAKDKTRLDTESSKIYFWMSILKTQIFKVMSFNFSQYPNIHNLIEEQINFDKGKIQDNNDVFNDDEILFLMASDKKKTALWNKANFNVCIRYWKIIEFNKDMYIEKSDSFKSESGFYKSRKSITTEEIKRKEFQDSIHIDPIYKDRGGGDNYFNDYSSSQEINESKNEDEGENEYILPEILTSLWIQTTDYLKLFNLWTKYFNITQKICLWNSLEIPFKYIEKLAELENAPACLKDFVTDIESEKAIYDYKKTISSMKAKDLQILLNFIIFGQIDAKNLKSNLKQSHEEYFSDLMQQKAKFSDAKFPLWFILTLKEKVLMCISQTNPVEFKLMVLLILIEQNMNNSSLCHIDKELEGTINNLIFEKYLSISEQKAIASKNDQMNIKLKDCLYGDSKSPIEYIEFIGNSYNKINKFKYNVIMAARESYFEYARKQINQKNN